MTEAEFKKAKFPDDTCYDYVDSVKGNDDQVVVTIFIEPCGEISYSAPTEGEAFQWWHDVLTTQPKKWDYCNAGWHLWDLYESGALQNIRADRIWAFPLPKAEKIPYVDFSIWIKLKHGNKTLLERAKGVKFIQSNSHDQIDEKINALFTSIERGRRNLQPEIIELVENFYETLNRNRRH